jgi:hypothetical protein
MERRLRNERDRLRWFTDILKQWKDGRSEWYLINLIGFYEKKFRVSQDGIAKFRFDLEETAFQILKERYEKQLKEETRFLDQIEQDIWNDARFENVENRLWSLLDSWEKKFPNAVKRKNGLQKLADDEQNVHTRFVVKQTNTSTDIINKTPVPKNQCTIDEILTAWIQILKLPWSEINDVYLDMEIWGKKEKIYTDNDYLYRNTLRGLWALIKTYEGSIFRELLKRLYEECKESLEMCGQGHITRLANVLVGFHESFLSPQSDKTLFQDKIASLAADLNLTLEEKIKETVIAMDEYSIPQAERAAWIEALY